jgi:hypothetical protein
MALSLPFLGYAQHDHLRRESPELVPATMTVLGVVATAAQSAGLGILLGAVAAPQLAAVLLVALLIASRIAVPELAAGGGVGPWLAALLPDAARLDYSRECAFRRPLDTASAALACGAAAAQATAYLALAAIALRRREP